MEFDELAFQFALEDAKESFGLNITTNQENHLRKFITDFIKWNSVHNLSAVKNFEELMRVHLLDSMSVIHHVQRYLTQIVGQDTPKRLADLGSGGGFPSIIIAILLPNIQISAIESIKKKAVFLLHIKNRLGLLNLIIVDERVELFAKGNIEPFDATISRAFTELNNFLEYSRLLIREGGFVFAMKSQKVNEELVGLKNHWQLIENIALSIPKIVAKRCLLVIIFMRK